MLRRVVTSLALAAAASLAFVGVAGAQDIPDEAPAVTPVAALTISAFLVHALISFGIPALVGLITKLQASNGVKIIVNLVLNAVHAIVETNIQADGTAIISATTAQYAVVSLGISIVSYLGIYKPLGANAKLAPNTGLG